MSEAGGVFLDREGTLIVEKEYLSAAVNKRLEDFSTSAPIWNSRSRSVRPGLSRPVTGGRMWRGQPARAVLSSITFSTRRVTLPAR